MREGGPFAAGVESVPGGVLPGYGKVREWEWNYSGINDILKKCIAYFDINVLYIKKCIVYLVEFCLAMGR